MTEVQAPDATLVRVADALDETVSGFLTERRAAEPTGQWEAPIEAWMISNLIVRSLDGLTLMARTDIALAPPAIQCARAAFEQTVKALWLLHPEDRFASEVRWLAHLDEWRRYERSLAIDASDADSRDRHQKVHQAIEQFQRGVSGRLPAGYKPLKRLPSLKEMMSDLGINVMYERYRELSQPVHGTMQATQFFRRNFGTMKSYGDFTSLADWVLPMRLSLVGVRQLREMVLLRCGATPVPVSRNSAREQAVDQLFVAMAERAVELLSVAERTTAG